MLVSSRNLIPFITQYLLRCYRVLSVKKRGLAQGSKITSKRVLLNNCRRNMLSLQELRKVEDLVEQRFGQFLRQFSESLCVVHVCIRALAKKDDSSHH